MAQCPVQCPGRFDWPGTHGPQCPGFPLRFLDVRPPSKILMGSPDIGARACQANEKAPDIGADIGPMHARSMYVRAGRPLRPTGQGVPTFRLPRPLTSCGAWRSVLAKRGTGPFPLTRCIYARADRVLRGARAVRRTKHRFQTEPAGPPLRHRGLQDGQLRREGGESCFSGWETNQGDRCHSPGTISVRAVPQGPFGPARTGKRAPRTTGLGARHRTRNSFRGASRGSAGVRKKSPHVLANQEKVLWGK